MAALPRPRKKRKVHQIKRTPKVQTRPHAGRGLCEGGTVCGCPLCVKIGQWLPACRGSAFLKVHQIKTPLRGRNTCPFAGKDSVKENRKVVFRVPSGQHLSTLYRVGVPKGSPNKKDARRRHFVRKCLFRLL